MHQREPGQLHLDGVSRLESPYYKH
jgi:hypothetical protein